ncbi:MAG: site-specific integrase [Cyanothece sp. SIO1E1]|nr:site-specific integrase [Cyanothece sp. SIO1E1]
MIEGRVAQANGRLKAARVGVSIEVKGDRLYLRATFPPKPSSPKQHAYQQRLALGYRLTPAGLKRAEQEARKIGVFLNCGEFSWEPYLRQKLGTESVGDWISRFEEAYFTRRAKTPQSETTWRYDYLKVFSKLPADQPLTIKMLRDAIIATEPDTRTRKRFVDVSSRLAKFAGLDADFKELKGNYSPQKVNPRNLPSDRLIAEWREKIPNPEWQYAYGLIATYGLRPHEVFYSDLARFPIIEVDGKTGKRLVYPFYPEWCDIWNLAQGTLPVVSGKTNSDLGSRVTHAFSRYEVTFNPYDLRHAWAVRSLEFGLDISLAAQQMGHSVKVHSEIYHAWISEDVHQRAYEALINRPNRPYPPQP